MAKETPGAEIIQLKRWLGLRFMYLSINIQLNADEALHTFNVELISCYRSICKCAVCFQRAGSWTTASH